ncbi:hypothetical protein CIHG_03999 [Coccidioides immitis H538.4]|uniref:Uncharacterized protein n=1 Tax=Coccidioides immitis H538.4 TaxID=396776 RepID=A0A0J8RNQ2_COCIT|nr:hypothetical protein CIHG_03999 [Coccidioides immitis H538.4]
MAMRGAGYIIVDPDFVAQILLGDGCFCFAIVDLAQKVYGNDTKSGKQPERASVKEPRVSSSSVAMWGNFDGSRRQSVSVYNSPYAPGFGFSQYAIKEYGLGPPRLAQKEHSAADFFAKLSQEDKEKVIQACGSVNASRKAAASTSIAPGLEMSQVSGLGHPGHYDIYGSHEP